jgi:putative transposase
VADVTSADLARRVCEILEQANPDLPQAIGQAFAEALMSAEADAACGAPYGQVSGAG